MSSSRSIAAITASCVVATGVVVANVSGNVTLASAAPQTLLPAGAVWSYDNSGKDLGTGWRTGSVAAWKTGGGELGTGDGDETTNIGTAKKTAYFRKSVSIANPATLNNYQVKVKVDDGAVVYLNGSEVGRVNMPTGTVKFATSAATVDNWDGTRWDAFPVNKSLLKPGENKIAVEVHQNFTSTWMSSDVTFDALLTADNGTSVSVPAAPSGVTATGVSPSQVDLSWSSVAGATSYQVLRNGTQVGTTTATVYTDSSATAGTSYTYTVKAVNAAGTSPASASTSVTTAVPAPNPPTGVTATANGQTGVNLSWTAAAGADSYRVFRNGTLVGSPTTNSYSDTGLAAGTSYTYTVKAVNSGGVSGHSASASVVTVIAAPTAPTNLKVTWEVATSDSSKIDATVTWQAVPTAESYRVFRNGTAVGTTTATTFTETALNLGVEHTYTVKAINAGGTSPASQPMSFLVMPQVLPAPSNLAATATSQTHVALTWQPVTGAQSYKVIRNGNVVATPTTASYTDTGLNAATTYSYVVKAVNAGGDSVGSASASTTTWIAVPTAPASVTAAANGQTAVNLTWTPSPTATSYQVLRNGTPIGTTATASYTDTGLNPGTTYSYTVKAINAGGTGTASATAVVTTVVAAPAAPGTVTPSATTTTSTVLTWTPVATATSYQVLRNGVQVGTPTTASFTDVTLTGNTSYSYTVKAVNAGGVSAASPAGTVLTVPTTPTGLTAVATTPTAVTVTWAAPATGAPSYQVTRNGTPVGTATTTSYTDTTVTAGASYSYTVKAINTSGASAATPAVSVTTPTPAGRAIVWSDEFNATTLDTTRWKAYHNTYGDGNNELACLTPNNVTVTGGMAVITSKKEPITCPGQPTDQYSSAFLGSREAGKYYPLYGRYEIRVQMAHAQGIWPAFWLRHRNGSGVAEVDILESFHNQVPGKMTQTLHLPTTAGRNIWKKSTFVETPPAASAPGAWHTYAVDISPITAADGSTDIKFEYFIDNKSTGFYIHTAPEGWNTADPNASWDIAVNQAVGGNWVGHPEKQLGYLPYPNKCSLTYKTPVNADPTTCPTTGIQLATFPVKYHVDYVRVYAPVS